jgi:hypothetical protein
MNMGGEEAIQAVYAQRKKDIKNYTTLLKDSDTQIMGQFKSLMHNAQIAFWASMVMHVLIFMIGLVILAFSFQVALQGGLAQLDRFIVGVGGTAGSLITLLLLFYNNPLKNIRGSLNSLLKVNVIYLGYVRQINQIDATFKQSFFALGGSNFDNMNALTATIRETVKHAMLEIRMSLADEEKGAPAKPDASGNA